MVAFFPHHTGCIQWSIGDICSGHGICQDIWGFNVSIAGQPNTMCICSPAWSGKGHLINLSGHDCHSHYQGLLTLHILLFCIALLGILMGARKTNLFLSVHGWKKSQKIPGFQFAFAGFITCIIGAIVAINQFFDFYIGDTYLSTLVYLLYLCGSWFSQMNYTRTILSLGFQLTPNISPAPIKNCAPILIFLGAVIFQFIPTYATSLVSSLHIHHILIFCFSLSWCIFIPSWLIIVRTMGRIIIKTLLEEYQINDFFKKVRRMNTAMAIRSFHNQCLTQIILVVIVYGMVCVWPWFRVRVSYWIPLSMSSNAFAYITGLSVFSTSGGLASNHNIDLFSLIISTPSAYQIFLKFLEKEYSSENLIFWQKVQEYKFIPKSEAKLVMAIAIYKEFISSESNKQVTLAHHIRSNLDDWYADLYYDDATTITISTTSTTTTTTTTTSALDHSNTRDLNSLDTLYDAAQYEIFRLISTDCLIRFQETKEYSNLRRKWNADIALNILSPTMAESPTTPTSTIEMEMISKTSQEIVSKSGEDLDDK